MNILLPIVRRVRRPYTEPVTKVLEAGAVCPHCGRASKVLAESLHDAPPDEKAETLKVETLKTDSANIKPAKKKSRVETPDN